MMQSDPRDLMLWFRSLATMLRNRMPMHDALEILAQISSEPLDEISGELAEAARDGVELSAAMAEHRAVFSQLVLIVCHAGEMAQTPDKALDHLAAWMESTQDARDSYDLATADLQMHGKIAPAMEELVQRECEDFGSLVRAIAFCRIFAMCAKATVPAADTFAVAGQLYMDTEEHIEIIEKSCEKLAENEHDRLAECLEKIGLPEIVCALTRTSTTTGHLHTAMDDAADLLERERDYHLKAAVNRIVRDY